jgi:hypothetical protein
MTLTGDYFSSTVFGTAWSAAFTWPLTCCQICWLSWADVVDLGWVFWKAGAVVYAKVPALQGLDMRAYRGKSREEVRISVTPKFAASPKK